MYYSVQNDIVISP